MNECLKNGETKEAKKAEGKIVATIGKWEPLHNGHKEFLVKLAKDSTVKKLIIMIGSCYERSLEKHSITATEREKMIRAVMKAEDIPEEKFSIIPVPDYETFEEWICDILEVCKMNGVTHFCTGNTEEILDIIEKRKMNLGLEFINPETTSTFPYHATDIRELIKQGNYEKVSKLIPKEVHPILFKYAFGEIIAAGDGRGIINFVPGRQTVDMCLLIRNSSDGKVYVLLGNRPAEKEDFPGVLALPGGSIQRFETAISEACRILKEETGLKVKIHDNSMEPAVICFEDLPTKLELLHVNGIYGSNDEQINGTQGGSSQCFTIYVEGNLEDYKKMIDPKSGLTNVSFYDVEKVLKRSLAFQHEDMIKKSIAMFEAYPNFHNVACVPKKVKDTFVIFFVGASGTGKSTAALGTAFMLKKQSESVEYVAEFAKSLVYTGTLEQYIPNQSYIISEQYKKIYDLLGKVDYVISDAGLQISALHSSGEKVIEDLAWHLTGKINQFTILIERDPNVAFETEGRIESEEESKAFGEKFEKYMKANNAQYIKVVGSDAAIEKALEIIKKREQEKIKKGEK